MVIVPENGMKISLSLKIRQNKAKKANDGLVIWQLLLLIVLSGLVSSLILFTQKNNQPSLDCEGKDTVECSRK
ncbi:hypothetical protein [Crocosphaera watsonii]|nr:hypothetical protein [Crocosphaera watsonii]